jgi:methylase of polypeptide subunit release factors
MVSRLLRSIIVSRSLRLYHKATYRLRREISFHGARIYLDYPVFNPKFAVSTDLLAQTARSIGVRGRVLDFGCGSGAISIILSSHIPGVREVVCYDNSPEALRVASINVARNRVYDKVIVTDKVRGLFDYIVSNPPYLPLDPMDSLDRDWCAGSSLEVLRELFVTARKALSRGGFLVTAYSSLTGRREVKAIASSSGFREIIRIERVLPLDTVYVSVYRRLG